MNSDKKQQTFHIYGDSFVNDDYFMRTREQYNWAQMLAEKMGYSNIINKSLPGSPLESSIIALFDDILQGNIQKQDFILFHVTFLDRCPMHERYQSKEHGAGHNWVASDIKKLLGTIKNRASDYVYNFYKHNENFYKLNSLLADVTDGRIVSVLNTINSVCDNTLMTFNMSPTAYSIIAQLELLCTLPTQCFVNTNMATWASSEFIVQGDWFSVAMPGVDDIRNSHFSRSNHILIADKLFDKYYSCERHCDGDFIKKRIYDNTSEKAFLQTPDNVIEYELSSFMLEKIKELRNNAGISDE